MVCAWRCAEWFVCAIGCVCMKTQHPDSSAMTKRKCSLNSYFPAFPYFSGFLTACRFPSLDLMQR